VRARLLDQRIQVGDTREMVYIALGPPLTPPTLTQNQPPLEHWEFLAFYTAPAFPAGNVPATPLESSPTQPAIQAQTTNNVVVPDFGGPSAKLLVVEFGADDKVADWKLYGDAQGRALNPGFAPIYVPKSPRAKQ